MAQIKVLSTQLINKIAAGEVVERPASVVKELMENSLDAGAIRINVEIEDGGKKLIRISDNGCGMNPDDLALACASHATSKITSDEDLFSIVTLGFRGEALASIASVSHLDIVSRPADSIEGARLEISGGRQSPVTPTAASAGTVVTIRNLFFNTPARRKFLRTTNTEMGHITEQFTRIALAHTEAQFSLMHNSRKIHDLPAGQTLQERIGSLFTAELAQSMMDVHRKDPQLEISGLIAHPNQSRTGTQWQYVFLNGRHIRDRFIGHAIRESYRGLIEINRQPVVFLFLKMPPDTVDVNVHPAKTEVRFANSNLVHSQVLAAIRDRLLGTDLTISLKAGDMARSPDQQSPAATTSENPQEHQQRVRQAMADFFKSIPPPTQTPPVVKNAPPTTPNYNIQRPTTFPLTKQSPPADTSEPTFMPPADTLEATGTAVTPDETTEPFEPQNASNINSVLQIHNAYLVTQTKDGLIIIDQHALHERILYEKLSSQFNQGRLARQRRLIPEVIDVTAAQMAAMENHSELLRELGIEMEQFGPRSIAIQSFPVLLDKASPVEFVGDLLDMLIEQAGQTTRPELIHHVLDMMACKAAVKAGDPLSESEISALLAQRHLIAQAGTCPHGRPTTIRLSLAELEKQFKRT